MEQLQVKINPLNEQEKVLLLGAIYRQALLNLGHSPDTHIENLREEHLSFFGPSASSRFLRRIMKVYAKLDFEEKAIFRNEGLENGRHYAFWYLPYCDYRIFAKKKKDTFEKVVKDFWRAKR